MKLTASVIIASKNYGRYLGAAIRSVLAQTIHTIEVIIVDDGSTDDTPVVVQAFLSDARVRYLRTNGLGQSRAKNLGIMQARGLYLAFLDGDDEWLPTKLEQQLPLFQQADIGVVYTRRILMDAHGTEQPTPQPPLLNGFIYEALLVRNTICFSSVVVRRDVFDVVGMFNPQQALAIDYDLWLRIAKHYQFAAIDQALVRYRTGHANLSTRIAERVQTVLSVLRRSLSRHHHAADTDQEIQGEAWGSTCRTMAYVQRERSLWQALRWYWRAAWYDRHWTATLKSSCGALYHGWKKKSR